MVWLDRLKWIEKIEENTNELWLYDLFHWENLRTKIFKEKMDEILKPMGVEYIPFSLSRKDKNYISFRTTKGTITLKYYEKKWFTWKDFENDIRKLGD